MHDELNEIPGASPDFRTELAEKLADLVPEAVADGKIDTKKLEELLDGDAADTRERFGLFWPGKKRALRAAQEPTTATLVPDKENSKDWDTTQNVFIEGDNLEVLKILQKHYHGKIKMIYIDPPYNTGKDFVYPDNYQEGLKSYLEFTKQVDEGGKKLSTNSDQAGRYHSNWLNMMYPRLKLARNLLAHNGVLLVHIDEHESHHLRRLLEEVFGENQFLGEIVWNKQNPKGDALAISYQHESILVFARSAKEIADKGGLQRDKPNARRILAKAESLVRRDGRVTDDTRKDFKEWLSRQDFGGGERAYSLLDDDGNVYQRVSMAWPNEKPAPEDYHVPLLHPITGMPCPVPEKGWRNPSSTMRRLVEDGFVDFGPDHTTQPRRKYLLKENLKERIPSIYNDGSTDSKWLKKHGIEFSNPKPVSVVSSLISWFSDADDMVLDFFSGSGTTAHAVMLANSRDGQQRKHLQVQLPEPTKGSAETTTLAGVARRRIRIAGEELEQETGDSLDTGFRAYRLSDTNFAKWRLTSDVAETELEQHLLSLRESTDDQASQEALLTELLLKRGYSLTEQVDVFDVAGLEIHGVRDDEGDYGLLAYLNEHQKPSLEQLRALVDVAEAQIVILEDAFQGDDQLKTNLAQLCKSKGIELWTA